MKKIYFLGLAFLAFATSSNAQSFTNSNSMLNDDYHSGGTVGIVDMDNDGFDDIVTLDDANHLKVLYQVGGGLTEVDYGVISGANQWGFAIGDCDNDGHCDVFSGGAYDGVHLIKISEVGVYTQESLNNGSMFMQACNLADIDNDGMLDAFGCHDDATARIWTNDGTTLVYNGSIIDLESYDFAPYNTDHSGNYGSLWTDFDDDGDIDLYIAKCRQGVNDPNDPRRINQLWVNDGNGNYTEEAVERGLVVYEQSWTADFADIDNDGDFDCFLTNHSNTCSLLRNDAGYFTDISAEAGLNIPGFFLQAKMADFDNDGFVDLIYTGGLHAYHKNNGDGTFTQIPNMFPNNDTMHSLATGDMNKDGWVDVYASYGNTYVNPDYNNEDILWMNNGGDNNWVAFDLEGIESNMNAVGAKVKIYGDWGVQVREVRAGESYGINTTFHCMFGLGQSESITEAIVEWPSGFTTVIEDPEINVYHNVLEAPCSIADVNINVNGSLTLCPGETVELSGPAGYTYDWSNDTDQQSIIVAESGNYGLIVYDELGCAGVAQSVSVEVLQSVAPSVTVLGDLEFCEGGSVDLISSAASEYSWTGGANDQSITVTQSGDYMVTIVDACNNELSSEMVSVTVLPAPTAPIVNDIVILPNETVIFDGADANLNWYANVDDTTPLFTGEDYTTDALNITTSYWVEAFNSAGGDIEFGGRFSNAGDGAYHNNSIRWQLFDAFEDMTLVSVKVYADGEANRTIELVDEFNNVLASTTALVPDGESRVDLNFEVPEGTNYGLRCADDNPQLWRSAPPAMVDYPYALGSLGEITQSTATGDNAFAFYYFFYDWEVASAITSCVSERVEVTAIVSGVDEIEGLNSFEVYPNPTDGILNVALDLQNAGMVQFDVIDITGRTVLSFNEAANSGVNNMVYDLNSAAAGVYQLRLTVGNNATSQQIIVR